MQLIREDYVTLQGKRKYKIQNTMNILELSKKRFSVRKFTDEPVSKDDLDYIMEVVRMAPSACNRQPWKFLIAQSSDARAKVQACYDREWLKSAPLYIVAFKDNDSCWVRPEDQKPHGDIDVAIATEHLCLAAAERGLGTCWVCNFDPEKARLLAPSANYEAVAIIPLGHPAAGTVATSKMRKPMSDIIETC
jgi:nitroreductase